MNLLQEFGKRLATFSAAPRSSAVWPPRKLALALQGGGSFGAFTWGVLDRLLEEDNIAFDMMSGASAGAFNAVVLAAALAEGDRQLARTRLERFWWRISQSLGLNPFGTAARFVPGAAAGTLSFWTSFLSPYQFNPLDLNPLRAVLNEEVDFASLRRPNAIRLLLAATRVSDGRARIFTNEEIEAEMVLASASLPLMHHAVKIADDAYWDGGYSANPPLVDLALASSARDILIVQVTPIHAPETPVTSHDIIRRLGHITFNASLAREMVSIERLIQASRGTFARLTPLGRKFHDLRQHHIAAEDAVADLYDASEMNLAWDFLIDLRDRGRAAADNWLRRGAQDAQFASDRTTGSRPAAPVDLARHRKRVRASGNGKWKKMAAEYSSGSRAANDADAAAFADERRRPRLSGSPALPSSAMP